MKRFTATITLLIALTGLCFAKPVFKTVSGAYGDIELAYTNDKNDVVEIVNLFKLCGKVKDDKRLDFKMAYLNKDSLGYTFCVVSSGKSYTIFMPSIKLSQFAKISPNVFWLEQNDEIGCLFLDCDRLPTDKDVIVGTVEQAIEHKHFRLCPRCEERLLFSDIRS